MYILLNGGKKKNENSTEFLGCSSATFISDRVRGYMTKDIFDFE